MDVAKWMTRKVTTVRVRDTAESVRAVMAGIIARSDILRAFAAIVPAE